MTSHYFKTIYAELDRTDKKLFKDKTVTLTVHEMGDQPISYSVSASQVLSAFSPSYFKNSDSLSKGRIRIEENNSQETKIIHDIEINRNSVILCWVISPTECWIKAKLNSGIYKPFTYLFIFLLRNCKI